MAISKEHKKHIESLAESLLKKASIEDSVPVDLNLLTESVGLRVEYYPFPNEISGLLKKELKIIGVNSNQNERRQRFTLAHEIGHYILGHSIINEGDLIDDANTDSSSGIEREANYFASALLMPEGMVKKFAKETLDIPVLAKTFNVSEQAMTIRILELGLIK